MSMAYTRAVGRLTVDNPHADALLTVAGFGRDWNAAEANVQLKGSTADLGTSLGWDFGGLFEYLKDINAIGPIGSWAETDTDESAWQMPPSADTLGLWKLSPSSGALRVKHLHYYDAAPNRYSAGQWGRIRSTNAIAPNLLVQVWRSPTTAGDYDRPMFGLHFYNDRTTEYALCFPGAGPADEFWEALTGTTGQHVLQPTLLGKCAGDEHWTVIAAMDCSAIPTFRDIGSRPVYQTIRVEAEGGKLLVTVNGLPFSWTFGDKWRSTESKAQHEFNLGNGYVELWALGGPVKVLVQPVTYPASAVLRPHGYIVAPSWCNQTAAYREPVADLPAGTAITVESEALPGNAKATRPKVTFTTSDTGRRALLYCVQEYRAPTLVAGTSDPTVTGSSASSQLVALSGRIGERWRGSMCHAEIVSKTGAALEWPKANAKIIGEVSTDDGATWVRQFTGHVPPPELQRPERVLASRYVQDAQDIIESRLALKDLGVMCSFQGWQSGEAFEAVCNCAGIPSAKVNVASATKVLTTTTPGTRILSFREDAKVPSVLDGIANAVGYEWGQDQNGVLFLRPPLTHTAGAYDYTLDDDSTDAEDLVSRIKAALSYGEFANVLRVQVGEGGGAKAKSLADLDSVLTPGALRFIGDLRQRYMSFPDGSDLDAITKRLWEDMGRWCLVVEWTMHDYPGLMPDNYVRVQVAGLRMATGTILRVLSKQWAVEESGRYTQTLVGRVVEVPA
ncbi:MAG: hypothetical protein GYA36_22955 [Veillonellaceae bacterium]|nr:hypothetical protein [Veillonellaceae bacterium]